MAEITEQRRQLLATAGVAGAGLLLATGGIGLANA
jgi:hypothetical protein